MDRDVLHEMDLFRDQHHSICPTLSELDLHASESLSMPVVDRHTAELVEEAVEVESSNL